MGLSQKESRESRVVVVCEVLQLAEEAGMHEEVQG